MKWSIRLRPGRFFTVPSQKHEEEQQSGGSCKESSSQLVSFSLSHANIPLPPTLELKDSSEMDMSDVQKNLKCLYEYNVMLREKFLSVQSMLLELATKFLPSANDDIPNTSKFFKQV
ncbi:uncharacterized protein LOC133821213 isoform X1 [Humulus lupulus]|uniref:uncharacterized protein LOC133821213 isoform X1 n=1 Tax=Humulus lupulus TaxID=3486 RepID=UPI002B40A37E|nr:uncharacterized protein LOC133821213 isoform X1 [Humulus lupulus]